MRRLWPLPGYCPVASHSVTTKAGGPYSRTNATLPEDAYHWSNCLGMSCFPTKSMGEDRLSPNRSSAEHGRTAHPHVAMPSHHAYATRAMSQSLHRRPFDGTSKESHRALLAGSRLPLRAASTSMGRDGRLDGASQRDRERPWVG